MKKSMKEQVVEQYPELEYVDIFNSDGEVNWAEASSNIALSEDFIRQYADEVDWESISERYLSKMIEILNHKYEMCLAIEELGELSKEVAPLFEGKIILDFISVNGFSESFMHDFRDRLNWCNLVSSQALSEDFLDDHLVDLLALNDFALQKLVNGELPSKLSADATEKLIIVLESRNS